MFSSFLFESAYNFSGVKKSSALNSAYSLRYAEFVVPLVKAVQELDDKNQSLSSVIEDQDVKIENLEIQLNSKVCFLESENKLLRSQILDIKNLMTAKNH